MPNETFYPESTIRFGQSRGGNDLMEYRWGNHPKSILFLSGFTPNDTPLSILLLRWKNDLFEAERTGGILGDFDLKILKNKCSIRIIPSLNPDYCKINQNGLKHILQQSKLPLKSEDFIKKQFHNHAQSQVVDLNRNFNANWIKMKYETPQKHNGGDFPESEPEVAFFTARLKINLPHSAVILRQENRALYYPSEATEKELREVTFLGQYASLPTTLASDTNGTPFQWLTDRGVKVIEGHFSDASPDRYPKMRDFLTMCAALT
jgi:hypothetical protein